MKISLIGLGNVGTRVLQIIHESAERLEREMGESISVLSVSDSRVTVFDSSGLDIRKILDAKAQGDLRKSGYQECVPDEIFNLDTDAVVDVASATTDGILGRDLYLRSFEYGKDVITANKAPLALHWEQIIGGCRKAGKKLRFESSVAGGVPLFNLRDFTIIPSEVLEFRGIVSSSVNIILRDVLEGKDFQAAVDYAIKAGIAETNYHDDTLGLDAARKTVILSNALFDTSLTLNDITYEGVEGNSDKISALRSKGGKHRVVAHIKKEGARISVFSGIQEIKEDDPLNILGSNSLGYTVRTDKNGELLVVGLEDTPMETASGVVNDIALLAKADCSQ